MQQLTSVPLCVPSAQVFNTVLGPEIAQMLANAAQAETTGRMQRAVELYNESAVLLRVLVDLGQEEGLGSH